jgi:hypothetical protein
MQRVFRSKMNRKETKPSGSVKDDYAIVWRIDEDTPMRKCGMEEMVSSRDTISDTSTNLGDKVRPLWLLRSATNLEEDEVNRSGALIKREDGVKMSGMLIGESNSMQGGSV